MGTRLGPIATRTCGSCEGQGYRVDDDGESRDCDLCSGTGTVTVDVAPFVALESAMEHVQAIRTSMGLRRTENYKPKIGTPAYHVDAVEDRLGALYQQLVVMLPEEHERTSGGQGRIKGPQFVTRWDVVGDDDDLLDCAPSEMFESRDEAIESRNRGIAPSFIRDSAFRLVRFDITISEESLEDQP